MSEPLSGHSTVTKQMVQASRRYESDRHVISNRPGSSRMDGRCARHHVTSVVKVAATPAESAAHSVLGSSCMDPMMPRPICGVMSLRTSGLGFRIWAGGDRVGGLPFGALVFE